MITINKYLDDILFDFKEYVTSGVRLCDLKEVHFDAGNLPDYSDIHVQQLYLLRYAYDLAGVRPVTTEISFETLEKMPFPYDMEGSENLSLR